MIAEHRKLVLETLERVWALYPDLRLGQLVYFISRPDSVFYISNDLFKKKLEDFLAEKEGEVKNDC